MRGSPLLFSLIVAPILAIVFGIGCRRAPDAAHDAVTILYEGDEWLFGPNEDSDQKMLVFLPLVWYEEYYSGAPPGPAVASRWEHSEDWRRWTIHVQPGLTWHDGAPVTAHDLAFTIDLWRRPEVEHYAASEWGEVTAIDDSTLVAVFPEPSRTPLAGWDVFYPRHLLEGLDPKGFWTWDFWTRPVGNGAYRYVRHVPRTLVELEANPDYYRGKPRIERVIFKLGGTAALTQLLTGEVDIAGIGVEDVPRIEADPSFRVYHNLVPARRQIFWNHRNRLFADARVRRALTMAIDREELARVMRFPEGTPIFDGLCSGGRFRRGECGAPLGYHPEGARRLLEEVGWRDGNGDGILERGGRPFRFMLLVPGEDLSRAAVFVQNQLRRVGVRMEIQSLEDTVVRERTRAGDFEAVLLSTPNANTHHRQWFGPGNPIGYENPRVAAMIEQAGTTMESTVRDSIYEEIDAILRQEMPATFLFPRIVYVAAHRRIRGLESPFRANPYWHLGDLWIEED